MKRTRPARWSAWTRGGGRNCGRGLRRNCSTFHPADAMAKHDLHVTLSETESEFLRERARQNGDSLACTVRLMIRAAAQAAAPKPEANKSTA